MTRACRHIILVAEVGFFGRALADGLPVYFVASDELFHPNSARLAADDLSLSERAVISNPDQGLKPGYVFRNRYVRDITPGTLEVTFRLRRTVGYAADASLSWDVNSEKAGVLAKGTIAVANLSDSAYQDISLQVQVPPGSGWVDPRLYWDGRSGIALESVTLNRPGEEPPSLVLNEKPTALAKVLVDKLPRNSFKPDLPGVASAETYYKLAQPFLRQFAASMSAWLDGRADWPVLSESVYTAHWLALGYRLKGHEQYAELAAAGMTRLAQLTTGDSGGELLMVPQLYLAVSWLKGSQVDSPALRQAAAKLASRIANRFPSDQVEYGSFNRGFRLALVGEALLALAPDTPQATRWAEFTDQTWQEFVRVADTQEDSDHYRAIHLRHLLNWLEIRQDGAELWQRDDFRGLFQRHLYQVLPAGSVPAYGDTIGWNASWGHWVWFFEQAAAVYQDGRFREVAGRILHYSRSRIEKLGSHPETGREAVLSLMRAALVMDDTLAPKPREKPVVTTLRHQTVQREDRRRRETRQWFDHLETLVADKLILTDGDAPGSLALMVDAVGSASHSHPAEAGIVALMDAGAVLLMSPGYQQHEPSDHNVVLLEDFEGFGYDNTPYRNFNRNDSVTDARTLDFGLGGYASVSIENFRGYPATLQREFILVADAGVVIRDTLTSSKRMRIRWGPSFRLGQVGRDVGESWVTARIGNWVPVRGLGPNSRVHTRWRNPARDLLLYFLPDADSKLQAYDDSAADSTRPQPIRVQQVQRKSISPGQPLSLTTLLIPHTPGDGRQLAEGVAALSDSNRKLAVAWSSPAGAAVEVYLQDQAGDWQLGEMQTNARLAVTVAYADGTRRVGLVDGSVFKRRGEDLAALASDAGETRIPP